MSDYQHQPSAEDSKVVQIILSCRDEAREAKQNRMEQNKRNMDAYHLRGDFSHKIAGQSREYLPKVANAAESFVSFLQQGLITESEWFDVEQQIGAEPGVFTSDDIRAILKRQLEKTDLYIKTGDLLKTGVLQSLMIAKIGGKMVPKVSYKVDSQTDATGRTVKKLKREATMKWQLDIQIVRPEDYYPDPAGELYEIQELEIDLHELVATAEANPDAYDVECVKALKDSRSSDQQLKRARETGQNVPLEHSRKRVKVLEFWGTLVDSTTGEVLHSNCVAAVADEKFLIRKPAMNPFWHQESPFQAGCIIRVPGSKWHRSIMDAGSALNEAQNELYNLMLDAGIYAVHGIKQIREHWLEDPTQVSKGIPPGSALRVSAACPPGQKVLERVDTASIPPDAIQMYQINEKEFNASSFSNDLRMGGLPERQVKATEIVASNQSISGLMSGVTSNIESYFMVGVLRKAWLTSAQNMNDMDSEEIACLVGRDKAPKMANLSPEDRFAQTAAGYQFAVYGLSQTINKMNDFRKNQALLQTVSGSPALMAEFANQYSMGKFLGEIITSLDIDTRKIKNTPATAPGTPGNPMSQMANAALQQMQNGGQPGEGGAPASPGLPGLAANQSNIPQVSSSQGSTKTGMAPPRGEILSGGVTRPQG